MCDLVEPQPLSVGAVQALLKADEALVAILVGTSQELRVGTDTRARRVGRDRCGKRHARPSTSTQLRKGLDPLAQLDAEGAPGSKPGVVQGFDLQRAHSSLQAGARAGGARCSTGKRHLIVVPTGPLTSVPFQVLITAPPGTQSGSDALRDAAWLIKSHALSVLPSVQSLQALRRLAPAGTAAKTFLRRGRPGA